MTNPKVLADALVDAGIGEKHADSYYIPMGYTQICYDAAGFITDWHVAGKVLEFLAEAGKITYFGHDTSDTYICTFYKGWGHRAVPFHGVSENPCRAIIEAWYAAKENDDG